MKDHLHIVRYTSPFADSLDDYWDIMLALRRRGIVFSPRNYAMSLVRNQQHALAREVLSVGASEVVPVNEIRDWPAYIASEYIHQCSRICNSSQLIPFIHLLSERQEHFALGTLMRMHSYGIDVLAPEEIWRASESFWNKYPSVAIDFLYLSQRKGSLNSALQRVNWLVGDEVELFRAMDKRSKARDLSYWNFLSMKNRSKACPLQISQWTTLVPGSTVQAVLHYSQTVSTKYAETVLQMLRRRLRLDELV